MEERRPWGIPWDLSLEGSYWALQARVGLSADGPVSRMDLLVHKNRGSNGARVFSICAHPMETIPDTPRTAMDRIGIVITDALWLMNNGHRENAQDQYLRDMFGRHRRL